MGLIVRIGCSLFLIVALVLGLGYFEIHSRPWFANADAPRPPGRPLGLLAGLIGAGAVISFLVLLFWD